MNTRVWVYGFVVTALVGVIYGVSYGTMRLTYAATEDICQREGTVVFPSGRQYRCELMELHNL